MAQKRRIVPQLISTAQATPAQAVSTALLSPSPVAAGPSPAHQQGDMTLKEQSEYAAKHLGPGRRIYVDLKAAKHEVNWRKLLKERGALKVQPQIDPIEAAVEAPFKGASKRSAATSVFNSVIQKLEQQYVINADDDSDEDQDDVEVGETPKEGAEASDAEEQEAEVGQYDLEDAWIDDSEFHDYYGGDRRKAKYSGFFINKGEIEKTGELVDPQEPSPPKKRRKAKVEKASEEAPLKGAEAGAKPKRAKRLREQGAAREGLRVKKVKKAEKSEKAAVPSQQGSGLQTAADAPLAADAASAPATKGTSAGGLTAEEPPAPPAALPTAQVAQQTADTTDAAPAKPAAMEAQTGPAQPAPAQPAAEKSPQDTGQPVDAQQVAQSDPEPAAGDVGTAGAAQDAWELPQPAKVPPAAARKNSGSKGDEFVPSKEISAALQLLREAAASAEPPKKDGHRALPKAVNQLLPSFACAVMREAEERKSVLRNAADAAMTFLEPFTSRGNLLVRIKTEWERTRGGLAAADKVLHEEIARKTQVLKDAASMEVDADDDFVNTSPASSQSAMYLDPCLEEIVYSYISKRLLIEGGSPGTEREQKVYSEASALFPPGTVSEDQLRRVVARKDKASHCSPRNTQKERTHPDQPPNAAEALASGGGGAAAVQQPAQGGSQGPPTAIAAPARGDHQQRPLSGERASARVQSEQGTGNVGEDAAGPDTPPGPSAGAAGTPQLRVDARKPLAAMTEDEFTEWIGSLVRKAAEGGAADKMALIEASAGFRRGTVKSILHAVLMGAGKEGMTIPTIITIANEMGLTGSSPWEISSARKSNISSIVNGDPIFAHVGKSQYALAAFEGVVNVPHKRKPKEAKAPSAPTQPPTAAVPRTSEAAAPSGSQPQTNGAPRSAAAPASASQSQPSSEAGARAHAAAPAAAAQPAAASNSSLAANIAEQQRIRGSSSVPPAVMGSLVSTPMQQGRSQQGSGGAAAPPVAPAGTTSNTAAGAAPASVAAACSSQGQAAGSGTSQHTPHSNGTPSRSSGGGQKHYLSLINS